MLESYIQAILAFIKEGKLTVEQIKNAEYKAEVQSRIEALENK